MAEQDVREVRRGRTVAVLLVAAILAGGGFHAWRWYQHQQAIAALPTLRGAPEGMRLLPGSPGAGKVLVPGKAPPDRAQVERFKADQAALGFTVTEEKGGVLVVTPQQPPARPAGEGRTP